MTSDFDANDPGAEPKPALGDDCQEVLHRQRYGIQPRSGRSARKVSPFSFASSADRLVIVLSSVAAICAGALNPLLTVIYGQLVGTFDGFANGTVGSSEFHKKTSQFAIYYLYLAAAQFCLIYATTVGFYIAGERIARNLRHSYLKAIIRQNMAFFDTLGTGNVTAHLTGNMNIIQEAITSKISLALTAIATFGSAFVISFVLAWKLALILCSTFVVMMIFGTVTSTYAVRYNKQATRVYGLGASVAQEAIASARHVAAYGCQKVLADKYEELLKQAEAAGVKSRTSIAIMIGWSNAMPCLSYALSFYVAGKFVTDKEFSVSDVTSATLAIVIGAYAVVRVIPNAENFISAMANTEPVFETMSRQSPMDPFSEAGICLSSFSEGIELKDVGMIYPSRSDVPVLDGLTLSIPAFKTTALVGASGCGKSSILGLLERFYEPTSGTIEVDGHELSTLNLQSWRRQLAYVGQEPVLFNKTIFENIKLGLRGLQDQLDETEIRSRVETAARIANAHDFVTNLSKGYETDVGEKGLSLSGGQRQRIAIARAMVCDPQILLFDEATSALDTKAERAVQDALSRAAKGRTSIVVAHRLSTIRDADNIVMMSAGRIVEQGTHGQLMTLRGTYASWVRKQEIGTAGHEKDEQAPSLRPEKVADTHSMPNENDSEYCGVDQPSENVNGDPDMGPEIKPGFRLALKVIWSLNNPEAFLILGGLILSILAGFAIPIQSVFFAEILNALSLQPSQAQKLRHRVDFWSLMFVVVGIFCFVVWIGQGICFAYSTERLSRRTRDSCLRHLLRQDVSFLDDKGHSTGQLMTMLTSTAPDLVALGGAVIGSILTFCFTIVVSIALCLYVGWKLALVCAAMVPLVTIFGWIRFQFMAFFDNKIRSSGQKAAAHANEAISAIRTVASIGMEESVLEDYEAILGEQAAKSLPSILVASALYAFSQAVIFLCASLGFWYGSTLLASHEYDLTQFYICFAALISGSQTAGAIFSFAPDMSKAVHAAKEVKVLFNREPKIDTWNGCGRDVRRADSRGKIEFRDVNFRYPSRTNLAVLQDINMIIPSGQFVALVGASGSGKSTILSLIERFYDPDAGRIMLDDRDISELNINQYRDIISLVGQEPTIYSGTISENLCMGTSEGLEESALDQACKDANIYEFIMSLPQKYETVVGSSGNMLSGGQRQRLAIARALLRDPRILLLDEATSALDSDSEELVQKALDNAARTRTTIAIAHRLSTVQKADVIFVLEEGRIIERGTHKELLEMRGAYFDLVDTQKFQGSQEVTEGG